MCKIVGIFNFKKRRASDCDPKCKLMGPLLVPQFPAYDDTQTITLNEKQSSVCAISRKREQWREILLEVHFSTQLRREIRREKCKRGNIWRNSGEFIFIAVLHPVVDFESSESIVPASIFAKGSKIGKLTRLQIPNFYFFLQIWQHLESLENCIDGLKFIFCSKWIGYWPISLWKGRSVHFVAEDWTFPEIDREMVPKLSKGVSNTASLN